MRGYKYETRKGAIYILATKRGFDVIFGGETLGNYRSPEGAANDVAGGHTLSPSSGVDLGLLMIPYDIAEWAIF